MEICTNHSNKTCWVNLTDTGKSVLHALSIQLKWTLARVACLCLKHEKTITICYPFESSLKLSILVFQEYNFCCASAEGEMVTTLPLFRPNFSEMLPRLLIPKELLYVLRAYV